MSSKLQGEFPKHLQKIQDEDRLKDPLEDRQLSPEEEPLPPCKPLELERVF